MQVIEALYSELVKYAKQIIVSNNSYWTPDDLINETYINLFDKNPDFTTFKKGMLDYCLTEKRLASGTVHDFNKIEANIQTKVCSSCTEDLPIAAFRVIEDKRQKGLQYTRSNCKSCEAKATRQWRKLNAKPKTIKTKPPKTSRRYVKKGLPLTQGERLSNFDLVRNIINNARGHNAA